jgi:hypothetical protein
MINKSIIEFFFPAGAVIFKINENSSTNFTS